MKPPEKLYGYIRDNNFWLNHPIDQPIDDDDIEYHLAPQWVSVEDRLPEVDQPLLLNCEHYIETGYYGDVSCEDIYGNPYSYMAFSTYDEDEVEPTHWMPLPAPPEDV